MELTEFDHSELNAGGKQIFIVVETDWAEAAYYPYRATAIFGTSRKDWNAFAQRNSFWQAAGQPDRGADGGQGTGGTVHLRQGCQRKCARRRARCPSQRRHHAQGYCCGSAGSWRSHPSWKCRLGARPGFPALVLRLLSVSHCSSCRGLRHLNGGSSMTARRRTASARTAGPAAAKSYLPARGSCRVSCVAAVGDGGVRT